MGIPYWVDLGVSPTLITYAFGLAVLSAVITGVLPALKVTGHGVRSHLQRIPRAALGSDWVGPGPS